LSYSEDSSALLSRLQQLQCHFTWDLKLDVELETLSTRLHIDIDFHRSQCEGESCTYSLLAYVRYLQDQREEALSLLNQSEETIRERHGDESEKRLIVTYGDMAWLKYHDGDFAQSQSYCQKVEDILVCTPIRSNIMITAVEPLTLPSLSAAIDCFHKALEVQRHDTEWNAGYAIALFCREQAIKQLRFALEINPNNAALQCMLGAKLAAYKKYEEAESLVKKALENDPDNPHIIRHSGKYLRDRVSLQLWSYKFLLLVTGSLLALCYKQKMIAEECRRRFKVRKWRRICISHLEESVKRKRPFVRAWADLALLCAEEGDMSRAEEAFQQCLEKLPEVEEEKDCQTIHQRCGDFYLYHKKNEAQVPDSDWSSLKKKMKRRLAKNRGDGEALALLGQVARAEGDRKRAAEFYEKALNCDKDNEEYLSALCELRLELQ
uniref:Uncharacterized protein n=1 Tax=Neolamprologus brichardi TaxID=32507 RepID=A0A3Q4GDL3_NEOBR